MAGGELADAAIVFDLDGTLADTAPDIVRALNETLDIEGLPHLKIEPARALIGSGSRALIEHAAALSGTRFGAERLDELAAFFVDRYRADIAGASALFPGALAALDAIAAMGARLAVCTNKRTDLATTLLEVLCVADRFSAIVGADAVAERKPHPDHYRAAVQRAGGTVRRSLMVGDTAADAAAARGAGAPIILVSFGYGPSDTLASLGPDVMLDRFEDLPNICRRLLASTG
jgi:phosphoglycolate phosphatase